MDRRFYQRTKIDVEGVFLLFNRTSFPREFNGTIEDISESGIKIVFNPLEYEGLVDSININDKLHFNGYDEYSLFGTDHTKVFGCDAKVVRRVDLEDKVILGCMFNPATEDIENYVRDKKTLRYLSFCN